MNLKIKNIALWIFIGLLSLGQFQRIELGPNTSSVNIYFHDIFIFSWLFYLAIRTKLSFVKKFLKKEVLRKFIKIYKVEFIFFLITFIGVIFNLGLNKDLISVLYIMRLVGYLVFAASLKMLTSGEKNKGLDLPKLTNDEQNQSLSELRFKFFSAGLIILALGLLQITLISDTRFLAIFGWDDHYNRLISTIFDPGFTGIILIITYFYFLSLRKSIFHMKSLVTGNLLELLMTLVFFWSIALTYSRASYLSLLVGLITFAFINKKNTLKYLIASAIFVLMIIITPKPGGEGVNLARTSTIDARTSTIEYELKKTKPQTILIGNGLFSAQNSLEKHPFIRSHSRIPDNFLVNIFLSTGIFGFILAIILIIKWLIKTIKIDQELGIAILATLVHSQFNNSMLQSFVLLILLGGIASIKTKVKT
ncbi:O-antigen ligase family protein [Candidatus Woesebacteria bacterium]|nr:O-antigen ligase family protein [Candidatus Woesebacteria bacterium]